MASKTCANCGAETAQDARFCSSCGGSRFLSQTGQAPVQQYAPAGGVQTPVYYAPNRFTCPRCGSAQVNVQMVNTNAATAGRGCLWSIGRWFLIICTCGLWLLVGKARSRTKIKSRAMAVCQSCGHSWRV